MQARKRAYDCAIFDSQNSPTSIYDFQKKFGDDIYLYREGVGDGGHNVDAGERNVKEGCLNNALPPGAWAEVAPLVWIFGVRIIKPSDYRHGTV